MRLRGCVHVCMTQLAYVCMRAHRMGSFASSHLNKSYSRTYTDILTQAIMTRMSAFHKSARTRTRTNHRSHPKVDPKTRDIQTRLTCDDSTGTHTHTPLVSSAPLSHSFRTRHHSVQIAKSGGESEAAATPKADLRRAGTNEVFVAPAL